MLNWNPIFQSDPINKWLQRKWLKADIVWFRRSVYKSEDRRPLENKDPLENEDPQENEEPLDNEDPQENEDPLENEDLKNPGL